MNIKLLATLATLALIALPAGAITKCLSKDKKVTYTSEDCPSGSKAVKELPEPEKPSLTDQVQAQLEALKAQSKEKDRQKAAKEKADQLKIEQYKSQKHDF